MQSTRRGVCWYAVLLLLVMTRAAGADPPVLADAAQERKESGAPCESAGAVAAVSPAVSVLGEQRVELRFCDRARLCFQTLPGRPAEAPCTNLPGGPCKSHALLSTTFVTLTTTDASNWKIGAVRSCVAHVEQELPVAKDAATTGKGEAAAARTPVRRAKVTARLHDERAARYCPTGCSPERKPDSVCVQCGARTKKRRELSPLGDPFPAKARRSAGDYAFEVKPVHDGRLVLQVEIESPLEAGTPREGMDEQEVLPGRVTVGFPVRVARE